MDDWISKFKRESSAFQKSKKIDKLGLGKELK